VDCAASLLSSVQHFRHRWTPHALDLPSSLGQFLSQKRCDMAYGVVPAGQRLFDRAMSDDDDDEDFSERTPLAGVRYFHACWQVVAQADGFCSVASSIVIICTVPAMVIQ
jgi:hypothetical protein